MITQLAKQAFGDGPQNVVTRDMAKTIVHALEMIEIEQKHREGAAYTRPMRAAQPVEVSIGIASVVDTGERIAQRLVQTVVEQRTDPVHLALARGQARQTQGEFVRIKGPWNDGVRAEIERKVGGLAAGPCHLIQDHRLTARRSRAQFAHQSETCAGLRRCLDDDKGVRDGAGPGFQRDLHRRGADLGTQSFRQCAPPDHRALRVGCDDHRFDPWVKARLALGKAGHAKNVAAAQKVAAQRLVAQDGPQERRKLDLARQAREHFVGPCPERRDPRIAVVARAVDHDGNVAQRRIVPQPSAGRDAPVREPDVEQNHIRQGVLHLRKHLVQAARQGHIIAGKCQPGLERDAIRNEIVCDEDASVHGIPDFRRACVAFDATFANKG